MIIDSSAIIAILCDEPERKTFIECITKTSNRGLSVAGFVETSVVLEARYGYDGKGRHIAGLNFGDCFSYAAAKSKNEPLLFKGNDFSQTDIKYCEY